MSFLQDRVALVTGGSRGIGRAICEKLGSLGAMVLVNYANNAAKAEEVVSTIQSAGGKAEALCFDVSNGAQVEAELKAVLKRYDRVDVLVNNAGIAIDSLLVRTKNEDWERTLQTNLSGCFYTAKTLGKAMMKARYGRIVNMSSVIGLSGNAGQAAYAASKAGIVGLTKSLAKELAARGITVNTVAPGYIETDMTENLDESVRSSILQNIPANRLGSVQDLAEAVAFLCSPGADYITGQVLEVNGGLHM